MIEVREARVEDLGWMLEQAKQFFEYHPANMTFNTSHITNVILDMIEQGVVLIAEENGVKKGALGGRYVPNLFDPSYVVLTVLFLWAAKEHRRSKAIPKLLQVITERGKNGPIAACHTKVNPSLGKMYERFGYELMEATYTKGG